MRKGFTLIELLVVISVIALISSVGFVNFMNFRTQARDQQRKSDLTNLSGAIEQFRAQKGYFPYFVNADTPTVLGGAGEAGWAYPSRLDSTRGAVSPNLKDYMKVIPQDPIAKETCDPASSTAGYLYYHWDGYRYVVFAKLENSNDPDAQKAKPVPPTHWAATRCRPTETNCQRYELPSNATGGMCRGVTFNYWVIGKR